MPKTCQFLFLGERIKAAGMAPAEECECEVPCSKPVVAHITWPGGSTFHYCAVHYDARISFIRECARTDVLKLNGVL